MLALSPDGTTPAVYESPVRLEPTHYEVRPTRSHLATEAPPFALDADKVARLRPVLGTLLDCLAATAGASKGAAP